MASFKSESIKRKEQPYLATPDLTMAQTVTIPHWKYYPGKVIADLHASEELPLFIGVNTRSRIAQSGIVANDWHPIKLNGTNNRYRGIIKNYSARDITLPEGFGFGPLYKPSPTLAGEKLLETVRSGVDIDLKHLYFSTLLGTIVPAEQITSAVVPYLEKFGIQVNIDKMWEVDSSQKEPLVINPNIHTRQAVDEFLVPVENGVTKTPFVVTTTMPVDIHGFEATVITDLYSPLVHSPSVIHFPDKNYKWNGQTGDGVRLEIVSTDKYWISEEDLECNFPIAWFTAH